MESAHKIVAVETIVVDDFPNLCYVQLHTDDGIVGLGETFFGPEAVATHIHAMAAPLLIGQDPFQIERHWQSLYRGTGIRSIGVDSKAA